MLGLLGFYMMSFCYAAVTDIDTSGIHALEELHKSLKKRDIEVTNVTTLIKDIVYS